VGTTLDATIVIPTLGRVKGAMDLAEHLESLDPPPERSIFVFQIPSELDEWSNKNSSAHSVGILAHGVGASLARNVGASEADTRYLAFLDDDCFPMREDWLAEILRPLGNDGITLVTGPVHGWASFSNPFPKTDRAYMLAGPFLMPWGNPQSTKSSFCMSIAGGNFAVERALFLAKGGFLEDFGSPSLYEESELSIRISTPSKRAIWFSSFAPVMHRQAANGGMRHRDLTPSEEFLAEQKHILLRAVFGNSALTEIRMVSYRAFRTLLRLVRSANGWVSMVMRKS